MNEICQRAGVAKGTLYYHFDSKENLFLALLEQWMNGLEVLSCGKRRCKPTASRKG